MTRDAILALLDRRRQAMAWRDVDAFADVYAETARLESPLAGPGDGRDGIIQASRTFYEAFPDAVIAEEAPVIDGDHVAIIAQVTGSHHGVIFGLGATGRAFRFPMAVFLQLQDGRIIHERRMYDFTGLLVQIGVLRAKP